MRRLANFAAAAFVSPEFLVGLLVYVAFSYVPSHFESLGYSLKSDTEVWKYLPTFTLLLSGIAFRLSSKLRAPLENSSNKALYEWPLYQLLVDRVMVSMLFAGLCAVAALSLWIVGGALEPKIIGVIFLVATLLAAVTALTMLLAHQKLREILEIHGD